MCIRDSPACIYHSWHHHRERGQEEQGTGIGPSYFQVQGSGVRRPCPSTRCHLEQQSLWKGDPGDIVEYQSGSAGPVAQATVEAIGGDKGNAGEQAEEIWKKSSHEQGGQGKEASSQEESGEEGSYPESEAEEATLGVSSSH